MEKTFVEQRLSEIVQKIVNEFGAEKIILFGSHAWGTPTPDSDADLLIVKESSKPRHEREHELRLILAHTEMPLDILVYTPAELKEKIEIDRNLFLEDIINNGTVLYANHEIRSGMVSSR